VRSLFVPTIAATSLGQTMTPFDVFTARTIGAILLAVAIMNWSAGRQAPNTVRGILLGNIFLTGDRRHPPCHERRRVYRRMHSHAEESAGTDSVRMWRTWLTADTAVPQGQAQQVPFCTG
jgi:hypothetical protein